MRGRQAGEQLEKIRAIACSRSGLKLAHDEVPSATEIDNLYEVYQSSANTFVVDMTNRISELAKRTKQLEDPNDALELCMVAGLLVDRLTNRALLEDNNYGGVRKRSGISSTPSFTYNGTQEVRPYHGKEEM